jgi:hypothetical protein
LEDSVSPASEAFFQLLTGLRFHAPDSTLTLRYSPRLFGRLPGTEQLGRPLLLHTLAFDHRARLDRRWTFTMRGSGSAGELAYSNLRGFFPAGTPPAPATTISLMMGDADATLAVSTSRRNTLRMTVRTSAQRPLRSADTEGGTLVPEFVTVGGEVSDAYRTSRRDTVTLTGGTHRFSSDGLGAIQVFRAEGSLRRRTDRLSFVQLQAGALSAEVSDGRDLQVLPTAMATYGTGWGTPHRPWLATVSAGTQGFFDALTFDYRPVAVLAAELTTYVRPSFRTGAYVSALTSMRRRPLDSVLFETVALVDLPSVVSLSRQWDFLFGGRGTWLAPHLSDLSDRAGQVQFMLYVGFRHRDGSGPSRGRWLD